MKIIFLEHELTNKFKISEDDNLDLQPMIERLKAVKEKDTKIGLLSENFNVWNVFSQNNVDSRDVTTGCLLDLPGDLWSILQLPRLPHHPWVQRGCSLDKL